MAAKRPRGKDGRFLTKRQIAARKNARKRKPTARKRKLTTRRTTTRRTTTRKPVPRRSSRRKTDAPIVAAVKTGAGVVVGMIAGGMLARTGIAKTPLTRAALVGGAGLLAAANTRRLARLPLMSRPIANAVVGGMLGDAVWRISSPHVGKVPMLGQAAKQAGLLSGSKVRAPASTLLT